MVRNRLRALVALPAAFVLSVMSFTTLFGAETAAAAPNDKVNVNITKLTRAGGNNEPLDGPIYRWNRAVLEFDYDASAANPIPGDSFSVGLPAEFNNLESGAELSTDLMFGTVKAGECELPDAKQIVCTFGEAIKDKVEVRGHGMAALSAVATTAEETVPFNLNGDVIRVDLPGDGGIKEAPYKYSPIQNKWGSAVLLGRDFLNWDIIFTPAKLPAAVGAPNNVRRLTWKDTIVEEDGHKGHYFLTDKNYWGLYIRDQLGDPKPRYERLADASGRRHSLDHGEFSIDVQFATPDKPTEATITVTGPFKNNVNYYINYRTKPTTADNHPDPNETYTNSVSLQGVGEKIELRRSISYNQSLSVTIEFKDGNGGFQVTKKLSGVARTAVEPGTTFRTMVNWELPNGRKPSDFPGWVPPSSNPVALEVTPGKPAVFPNHFPVGTKITLSEDPASANPATQVIWGEPVFIVDGNTAAKEVSFVIENKKLTKVTLTNEASRLPKVSVGDFVWLDANKDGVQDAGEQPLAGIELSIVGPDGKPVTDVNGVAVAVVKTDGQGKYLFDDLPVLSADESYKVCVVTPAGLVPTKAHAADRDRDSSDGCETSQGLTNDGESDLTLDFGFIELVRPKLPKTGF